MKCPNAEKRDLLAKDLLEAVMEKREPMKVITRRGLGLNS